MTSASSGSSGTTGSFDAGPYVTTLAGNGIAGDVDGPRASAEFALPQCIAVDAVGNVYVTEQCTTSLREVGLDGTVTTLASFNSPTGVAVGDAGIIYVSSWNESQIEQMNLQGQVAPLAGNGDAGDVDGTGGSLGSAEFDGPFGLAVNSAGNVYVADSRNNQIREVDPQGNVSTLVGSGVFGYADGSSDNAKFSHPIGVAVDSVGNVYVADQDNNQSRKVDPTGNVSTLAGNGTAGFQDGTGGPSGTAEFNNLIGVAVDAVGNVYVYPFSEYRRLA